MNRIASHILSVLLIVSMTQAVRADEKKPLDADFDDFQKRENTDADGVTLLYRVLPPAKSDQDVKPPLLLFLHGGGDRGTDNTNQLVWGTDMMRIAAKKYGSVIFIPQSPPDGRWSNRNRGDAKTVTLADEPSDTMQANGSLRVLRWQAGKRPASRAAFGRRWP